eukprot:INCI19002.1.p1 GENE.INCI19002.1~~INCI19002.1.p1  ORF type:complete len:294 (+),score=59.11 INCI19002.1:163-1044(+)
MSATPTTEGGGAAAAAAPAEAAQKIDPLAIQWLEAGDNHVKYDPNVLDPDNSETGIYGSAESESYEVRGENYLVDKVKFPSRPEMFKLVSAGVFVNEKPMPHMAKRSPMLKKAINTPGMPFCFIVTWLIPGPPHYTVSQVFVRAIPEGQDPKFDKLFKIFSSGEDDVACRKARFKFIPNIVKCPFLVSAALRTLGGMRPVIIGNKLENQYYYGKNYMELVINISSSKVAASITHICTGTLKNMIVDLGFLIEAGHEPEFENELPERMLGCVRFKNCDLKGSAVQVDFDVSDVE